MEEKACSFPNSAFLHREGRIATSEIIPSKHSMKAGNQSNKILGEFRWRDQNGYKVEGDFTFADLVPFQRIARFRTIESSPLIQKNVPHSQKQDNEKSMWHVITRDRKGSFVKQVHNGSRIADSHVKPIEVVQL